MADTGNRLANFLKLLEFILNFIKGQTAPGQAPALKQEDSIAEERAEAHAREIVRILGHDPDHIIRQADHPQQSQHPDDQVHLE